MRIRKEEFFVSSSNISFPEGTLLCEDEQACWEFAAVEITTSRRKVCLCSCHAFKFKELMEQLKGTGQGNGSMGATI